MVSDGESSLELKDLVVNQAYYLIETEAPDGYILDQIRHYFMIYDPNTKDSAGNVNLIQPEGFPTSAYVAKGGSVFIDNRRELTSIHTQKQWLEADGTPMTVLPEEGVPELRLPAGRPCKQGPDLQYRILRHYRYRCSQDHRCRGHDRRWRRS